MTAAKPTRVLVVDDDPSFVAATAELLTVAGYEPVPAGSYHEALDALDREKGLDVLLTDVVLDVGNGFALGRAARYRNPALKVVFVTGYDVDMSEATGPVLRKPVTVETLTETIGRPSSAT
jgi:DNA-binding NtrC family response regulator